MASLKEYFHLKKDAFDIDPKRDAEVYFGYQPLARRILDRLASDFVQQRHVPKFFIHGGYGAGKTHTLAHIQYVLLNDPQFLGDFPATEPILTEMPPLKAKESWRKIHEHLMDEIGREVIKESMRGIVSRASTSTEPLEALQNAEVLRFGDKSLQNSQAQIFRNLLFGGRQETLSWEWLKGKQLSIDESNMLSTETNLTGTADLLAALLNVASLVWAGLGKKIVLLLDEAEMVRSVTNPDSVQEFTWALRRLVDNDNDVLGLVVGFEQEGGMEAAPGVFTDDAVQTRVGQDSGYIDLGELVGDEGDVKQFILQMLDRLVDAQAAKATIESEGLPTEPEYFPFTQEAVDRVTQFIIDDPNRKSPRQIKNLLSEAVVKAWLDGRNSGGVQLVDDGLLESVLYPGEPL